uniref:Uncharacterized protein n=1 Tax=Arundo donax TaxID=35708 RepID=A0A0A9CJE2_ARUDO
MISMNILIHSSSCIILCTNKNTKQNV